MKTNRIIYRITTAIIALMMIYSAYNYFTADAMQQAFHHLGFPDYFRIELAVAKTVGAILLLAPVPARVKEWAYAGFATTFISAFIAHTASGDPANYRAMPLIFLAILIVSYVTYHKSAKAIGEKNPLQQTVQLA
ncbi:MAG: DoxX family protein [Chitinophagaceae bacterium]|nr:DoxX family protein [Chitinophagaceae bacterium]